MLMKRLLTIAIVICVCMATASPTLAIEKRKKDTPPPKSDTTTIAKPQPRPQPQTSKVNDTLRTPVQRSIPPVFNDFIDVNMNGIDDRREQGGYLIPPKQVPKTPAAVKKADSTKTAISKPAAEKPKKKDK
jgi:hypothetical protein